MRALDEARVHRSIWDNRIDPSQLQAEVQSLVLLEELSDPGRFPPIQQCVGTHRLWGTDLALAFCYDIECFDFAEDLQRVVALGRAFLVLADHLVDEKVDSLDREILSSTTVTLMREILDGMRRLNIEERAFGDSLLGFSAKLKSYKTNEPSTNSPNVEERTQAWSTYFFPYAIESALLRRSQRERRMRFLRGFFTLCQIFDDFCDLDEDLKAEKWDNVFLSGRSIEECKMISRNRSGLVPAVLQSASAYLNGEFAEECLENPVLAHYVNFARGWTAQRKNDLGSDLEGRSNSFLSCTQQSVDELSLQLTLYDSERLASIAREIRPERLQSDQIPEEHLW